MMQSHCPIIVLMGLFHLTTVFGFCSFVCFWFGLFLFSLLLFLFAALVLLSKENVAAKALADQICDLRPAPADPTIFWPSP